MEKLIDAIHLIDKYNNNMNFFRLYAIVLIYKL